MNRRAFLKLMGAAGLAVSTADLAFPAPAAPVAAIATGAGDEIPAGYQILPSGLVLMWGAADSEGWAEFPLVLSGGLFNVLAAPGDASDRQVITLKSGNTGCLLSEPGALWLAIAHEPERARGAP